MENIIFIWEQFADYVLPFLIILGVLVTVHEWGHFFFARLFGVKIETFSIGFGKEIFAYVGKKTKTRWRIAMIPLGGYVKMFGDDDVASNTSKKRKNATKEEQESAFFCKPLWQRAIIVFAGPFINFLFAVIALGFLFYADGQPYSSTTVETVQARSAASRARMKSGDKIIKIEEIDITHFEQLRKIVQENASKRLKFIVLRDEKEVSLNVKIKSKTIKDRFGNEIKIGLLGIKGTKPTKVKRPFFKSFMNAAIETRDITVGTIKGLGQIIRGERSSKELGGPLRIAQMSFEVKQLGIPKFIWFMAVLSINLGLINLFPIPVLDGGHLMFYLYEAIFRRPVNDKIQDYMIRFGLAALCILMVMATWNDIVSMNIFEQIIGLFK